MSKMSYKGWYLPFIPIPEAPPTDGTHPIGLTLAEACKEFWCAKTYQATWNWSYVPNILLPATSPITWAGSVNFTALTSTSDTSQPPLVMSYRTALPFGANYALQSQAIVNGYSSGEESDQVQSTFTIDWSRCYQNAGLIYPYLAISVGGVEANVVTLDPSSPGGAWGGTCSIFGKTTTLYDSDSSGIDGGPKSGSVSLACTDYWPNT